MAEPQGRRASAAARSARRTRTGALQLGAQAADDRLRGRRGGRPGRDRCDRGRDRLLGRRQAAAASPISTPGAARPTASSRIPERPEAAAGQGREPEEGGEDGRLRACTSISRRGAHPHPARAAPRPTTRPTRRPRATTSNRPIQQADGAYSEEPEKIDFVHSLEHGRVEIQYSPELAEKDQLALKGLYETLYAATLLFPNKEMPYAVAATAWRHLMGCKAVQGGDHPRRDPRLRQGDLGGATGASRWKPSPSPGRPRANPTQARRGRR